MSKEEKYTFKYEMLYPFEGRCNCHLTMEAHVKSYYNDRYIAVTGLKEMFCFRVIGAKTRSRRMARKLQEKIDKTSMDKISLPKKGIK